ncbi:MAG: twin-arginine translocase subunit TatC [Anaerolineae bacterium]|nr:MAG: twin-arginine translocase subunit TatC [Anaerolineae bacterium]
MQRLRRAFAWLITAPFRLAWWLIGLPLRLLGWLLQPVVTKFRQAAFYRFLTEVPEDRPAIDAIADAFQQPESILEELDAFRKHLLRMLVAVIITTAFSFYFTNDLAAFLAVPVGGLQRLQAVAVTETVGVFMRVALISGLVFASPYIAFEIWLFVAPGLMPRTRQLSLLFIPLAAFFFISGMAFTYYAMLPVALPFIETGFIQVTTNWTVDSYIKFVTGLLFWIGLAFEFPLVIYGLSAIGMVKPRMLLEQWRLALVLIAVISALITPTTDALTMGITMLPLALLYFLSILFSVVAQVANRQKPT